ncbi:MAG: FAD-binding oxidoreductase [Sphingomonadaceae bacterium]
MTNEPDLTALAGDLRNEAETTVLEEADAPRISARGIRPRLLCSPSSSEALAAALACCDRAGAAVIPWGGGTQQRLGLPPRRADVILTTRRLDRLVEYVPGDLTVTVEAGMRFGELQRLLGERGQWLPLDPPLMPEATVGGVVATNVSGPRRIRDGGLRDMVIGTRTANVDGTLTRAGGRVVKNVTGYDLNKLHIGALGTVGMLVEVTLKVAPRPETERSWIGTFPSVDAAGRAVGTILRRPLAPTALDLLNDRVAAESGLRLPPGHWALLGRASGFAPAVDRHLAEFEAAARAEGATDSQRLDEGAAERVWACLARMASALRWADDVLTCRFALLPATMGRVCREVATSGGEPFVWGHGVGALFWSVPARSAPAALEAVSRFRREAVAAGGALVVENWPRSVEGVDVWGSPGGPIPLMRAIKSQFDPHGILNPGRFVGGM